MVPGARVGYVGIDTLVERGAKRYNASAIQAAGFDVRSEVPSHGYFHVMREVLMYLPGRAMACAGWSFRDRDHGATHSHIRSRALRVECVVQKLGHPLRCDMR
jgi:hypothetical protein